MTILLTRKQMQALDRIAIDEVGIPGLVLMEVAGRAVADAVQRIHDEARGSRVLALAGLGHNGGDAVVATRHLIERGISVTLAILGDPSRASQDMLRELAILSKLGIEPITLDGDAALDGLSALLETHEIAIDGIFGTGLSRPVEGLAKDAIEALNRTDLATVAVDVPSGVDCDTGQVLGSAVRADVTVTFQHAKLGHVLHPGRALSGTLAIADIGIPSALLERVAPFAEIVDARGIEPLLAPRPADSHKGTFGHLLVVAGVPDRPGSALLAGRAALRAGAGLVTIASDEDTVRRLSTAFVELMGATVGRGELEASRILEALEGRTALAIGPSLVPNAALARLVRDVLHEARVPAVVDAGALVALGRDVAWLRARSHPTVLTPHPGEMSSLTGLDKRDVQADRVGAARALADVSGAYVVLKGASTVVASPGGRIGVVTRGNPGMASGGTGDVLTGIIGALLAQRIDPELAARGGALIHGIAGDVALERSFRALGDDSREGEAIGRNGALEARLVASDLIECIGLFAGATGER